MDSKPLAALFGKPLQRLLDRGVDHSSTAAALCRRLEGRRFAIQTGVAALDRYFTVTAGRLVCNPGRPETADATISGTPLNLARLAGTDPEDVIRSGRVSISGDSDIATEFRALLDLVRPDWEEELSRLTGDVIAHQAGEAARGFARWAGRARHSLGRSLAEFLTEETRDLVTKAEADEFHHGVDQLAAAVDRCEARLRLLREQRNRT